MKKPLFIFQMVVLLVFVVGCSTSTMTEEQKAIEIAKQFKELDFTVNDIRDIFMDTEKLIEYLADIHEQIKPLLADHVYDSFVRGHYVHRYNILYNVTIAVKNIDFEVYDSNETELRYNYNLTLEIKHINDGLTKEVVKKGQMTLRIQDGSWKITRDWTDHLLSDEVRFVD